MAPARKRTNNIARRRRIDDEDEAQSVATLQDDSQSDASILSDVDEDADADNSDLSEVDSAPSLTQGKTKRKANGARDARARSGAARQPSPPIARSDAAFTTLKETEMMMNGLEIPDGGNQAETVDFETGQTHAEGAPAVGPPSPRPETFGERKRREHEEYKKKRDSDPAFIPNRGAFFMHDHRHAPGQNGFRPVGGRGRGRGAPIGGPFSPAKYAHNFTFAINPSLTRPTACEPRIRRPQTRPGNTISTKPSTHRATHHKPLLPQLEHSKCPMHLNNLTEQQQLLPQNHHKSATFPPPSIHTTRWYGSTFPA